MQVGDNLLGAYPEAARRQRRVRELGGLLAGFVASTGAPASADALIALVRWAGESDKRMPLPEAAPADTAPVLRRQVALLLALEDPEAGRQVRDKLARFLAEAGGLKLLAEAGLPNDRGLLQETSDRLFRRLLPAPRDDRDLAAVLLRMFPGKRALGALEAWPPDLFARLGRALGVGDAAAPLWAPLFAAAQDALVLLAARVQGLGLGEGIRDRGRLGAVADSPFYRLPRATDHFLAPDAAARRAAEPIVREAIAGCRAELRLVLQRLETAGVSLDVVYSIEVIERALVRMERLLAILAAPPGADRSAAVFSLLVVLVKGRIADRSLRALAYTNLHLLARKLVERAGQTGEHYITATRGEYLGMLARAAGGGLVTAFTAALKLRLAAFGLPYFVAGLVNGSNYALSFVIIQLCGLTLATKQPSMTAAALAGALGGAEGQRLGDVVALTARLVRSQLAAAIGNVTLVTAGALAIDLVWRQRTGAALLDAGQAAGVIASLHPFRSGTVIYAAFTGVILWVASLVGGWLENFAVCHRLPQAIAEHSAGRFIGQPVLRAASGFFARNISGLGTSVALGFMLGMTPYLGKFFGLPLDVRHVTLATGQLAFAVAQGGPVGVSPPEVTMAVIGIALTFVLNLGTSFVLALTVAMRAREIRRRDRFILLTVILRRFLRHPGEFLFPPGK